MPEVKGNVTQKLKQFISEYGENVFSQDGQLLYCKFCDVRVGAENKSIVKQRVNTCNYYYENFTVVKKIINSFESNEAISIKVAQRLLSDPEIAEFARKESVVLLVLYIIQVVCLIFAVIVLVLSFFSTYAFQAGLVELLYDRFGLTLFISVFYLLLTLALNIWTLASRWDKPLQFVWPTGLLALFVIQRLMAVIFYYLYKRSMLRIADPRFYEDFDWVQFQRSQMN
ncbi:unnamed protein product [Timema podura]|uniref:Transmembrane protein 138 n=1 Tax=Timema podura TaxID=61482 RepID=A0ABN7NMD6_TIMPD|nr:unnamed protein product [Timema podura]